MEASGIVTWPAAASLANGSSLTYSVTVTAPASGTLVNLARADAATADPDSTNNNGSAVSNRVTTNVGEVADLSVSKTGPATVAALGSVTYTILTTNKGPSTATSLGVTDTLPAGVTFVSADIFVTMPPPPRSTLAPATTLYRSSLTYSVTVTAPATGTLLNLARADAATTDPDSTNNNGS